MYSALRHAGAVLWKRRPLHLTFFVTRKCNARCPFCFYLQNAGDVPDDGEKELTLEEIRQVSRSLHSLLWLAFSGGEPFLYKGLAQMSRIFYEQNRPAIMLYPTNGLLPEAIRDVTEEIVRASPRSVVVVKVSLDGLRCAHDALRGVPGAFDKVVRTCELIGALCGRYSNLELGINTVFCSDNQDHMDDIIDFVATLDAVTTHTISLVRGDLRQPHFLRIDPRKYCHAIERLERNLKENRNGIYRFRGARLKAAQDVLQRRLIYRTALEQKSLTRCYAGRLNVVLSETGRVYPCETLTESLGNVRECNYDLMRVLRTSAARSVLGRIANGACHCTHECYLMTNILFNPRQYPALASEYLQLRQQ